MRVLEGLEEMERREEKRREKSKRREEKRKEKHIPTYPHTHIPTYPHTRIPAYLRTCIARTLSIIPRNINAVSTEQWSRLNHVLVQYSLSRTSAPSAGRGGEGRGGEVK